MKILLTGSSGYIGSCLYEVLKDKYEVYCVDKIKPTLRKQKRFYKLNLLDLKNLDNLIKKVKPEIVIHLASKSTIDFIDKKKDYTINNVDVTKALLQVMEKNEIKKIIFSSTAAVYKPINNFLSEKSKVKPNNIYGKTKLECENLILKKKIKSLIFRFFNVCGPVIQKKIGELHEPETHLIPILSEKFEKKKKVNIYGNNFQTIDGTCVRDYIHIMDIISAFIKGIKLINKIKKSEKINLGTNKGYSTLQVFNEFKNIYKSYKFEPIFKKKRKGDVNKLVCENKKAKKLMNWQPKNSNIQKIIVEEKKWLKFLEKQKIVRRTIY